IFTPHDILEREPIEFNFTATLAEGQDIGNVVNPRLKLFANISGRNMDNRIDQAPPRANVEHRFVKCGAGAKIRALQRNANIRIDSYPSQRTSIDQHGDLRLSSKPLHELVQWHILDVEIQWLFQPLQALL